MPATATPAGSAAPESPTVELPRYTLQGTGCNLAFLELECSAPHQFVSMMCRSHGPLSFHHCLTPQQARELAVALVDCANALDNPAQRVIVDEGHCPECGEACSMDGKGEWYCAYSDCLWNNHEGPHAVVGEGVGHE